MGFGLVGPGWVANNGIVGRALKVGDAEELGLVVGTAEGREAGVSVGLSVNKVGSVGLSVNRVGSVGVALGCPEGESEIICSVDGSFEDCPIVGNAVVGNAVVGSSVGFGLGLLTVEGYSVSTGRRYLLGAKVGRGVGLREGESVGRGVSL